MKYTIELDNDEGYGKNLFGGNEIMLNLEGLTEEEIFVVKWQYRLLGDFKTSLMRCIIAADDDNLLKLSHGFPKEVLGYKNYIEKPGWWDEVKRKVNIPVSLKKE